MLIYEKDNKLNINFENSVNESPDLQISKSGDKTEVLIDGQPGGGGVLICTDTNGTLDKTMGEIQAAFLLNSRIDLQHNSGGGVLHSIAVNLLEVHFDERSNTYDGSVTFANGVKLYSVSAATEAAALAAYPILDDR